MKSIIKHTNLQKGSCYSCMAFTLQSCFVAKDYTRPEVKETETLIQNR